MSCLVSYIFFNLVVSPCLYLSVHGLYKDSLMVTGLKGKVRETVGSTLPFSLTFRNYKVDLVSLEGHRRDSEFNSTP